MRLCINPNCLKPENDDKHLFCRSCGSELLLQGLYRVCRELGGGGFGKTYEVAEGDTLKVLKVLIMNNPIALRLFKQEAEVLQKLNHPGIPKVEADGYFEYYPRGSQDPIHCIVMEKIEGEDLATYLEKRGQAIPQKLALKWLIEIAEILHQVHTQGFLHRDIKPANIMLRSDGQLVLIDFGTVKAATATVMSSQPKKPGTEVYTPGYAPPEQVQGYTVHKSDFFAIGRSFVHLLTNKPPLDFYNLDTGDLEWRGAVPNISPLLVDFLDQLMQRLAKDRPKDTGAILQGLREIENQLYPPPLPKAAQTQPSLPDEALKQKSQPFSPPKPAKYKKRPQANLPEWGLISLLAITIFFGGKQIISEKRENKLLGAGILLIGLLETQAYGYIRHKKFPSNPVFLITNLPSSWLLQKTLTGHSSWVISVAISPDGQTLVSGSGDQTIHIWDLATGQLKRTLTGHSDYVNSVAISPDGQTLVSGSDDKTIKIWDLATGQLKRTLTGHSDYVNSVAISPDGQTLVSGSDDKTIKIWDLATGQLKRTLTGHSNEVYPVAISPDGQTLVSGSDDKTIKIWDLATGQLKRTLTGHSDAVISVAISPDGQTLVSGSDDKTIKIWDLATGQLKRTLTGHSDAVISVAISPDGQTLVSGSDDKTIKIWDLATGQLKRTLTGHSNWVLSVAISPDGQTLVSGSYDKTIKIWRLER
ncbi:serine/threonine-protein kinase [Gloeothece verrucosa]|uniref:Serine/threonine-protein kinase-like domain protein n=1 Tax=Gloeothece verrucosa (strain PCC 7822) TaxID=497965 RepID=E0UC38_GLOV7|nr:serine/threonine-protein kinase [Gloeothece verrucosa]ADN16376.1 Serine/threonine-protein kinase-like domain protein [Gloeothece verrucosa PCC 7822]